MKIDIHVHTRASSCSILAPADLLRIAGEMRVPVVVTTNHGDSYGDADFLGVNLERMGILYLPALELTCSWGDFLLFGRKLDEFQGYFHDFPVHLLPRPDIAVVWAHPYRFYSSGDIDIIKEYVCDYIDAVEVANGNCVRYGPHHANQAARELAYELGKPGTAGSDAHAPGDFFTLSTDFPEPVHSYEDFVRYIKQGNIRL